MNLAAEGVCAYPLADCWLEVRKYYAIHYPYYEMNPHCHPEWELMYIVQGRCQIFCWEGKDKRCHALREGEFILIGGNILHELSVEKGSPCRVLNLEMRSVPGKRFRFGLLWDSPSFRAFLADREQVIVASDDGSLHRAVRGLQEELRSPAGQAEGGMGADMLLGVFLLSLARLVIPGKRHGGGVNRYVAHALRYLEEHFDEEITVADVAGAAGVSDSYLQRLFREQTGETLVDKVSALRIDKAKLLLEASRLPILDVAVSVGFNNRQHFTYTFTKLTGISPAEYRKNKGASRTESFRGGSID